MSENAGVEQPTTSVPNTPPVGNVPDENVGTGNPADAGPTDHNPTDSSSVSDEVDHEGTGAGEETPDQGNAEEVPDGTDNA